MNVWFLLGDNYKGFLRRLLRLSPNQNNGMWLMVLSLGDLESFQGRYGIHIYSTRCPSLLFVFFWEGLRWFA